MPIKHDGPCAEEGSDHRTWTVESWAITDIGLKRQNNEDVFATYPDIPFFALADGMGGHQAGEVAAQLAVDRLCASFLSFVQGSSEQASHNSLLGTLADAVKETNAHVYQMAASHHDWMGMGTTLSCLFLRGQHMFYAHVGDSRIYRFRKGLEGLEQLTEDHSLRKEQPASNRKINKLTRAVGTTMYVEPEIGTTELSSGDVYLICSDGLTDHVPDEEIASFISKSPTLSELCQNLVQAAKNGGGFDNITVITIKVTDTR